MHHRRQVNPRDSCFDRSPSRRVLGTTRSAGQGRGFAVLNHSRRVICLSLRFDKYSKAHDESLRHFVFVICWKFCKGRRRKSSNSSSSLSCLDLGEAKRTSLSEGVTQLFSSEAVCLICVRLIVLLTVNVVYFK